MRKHIQLSYRVEMDIILFYQFTVLELEQIHEFQEFKKDRPSVQLRFAKDFLSNNKWDKLNYPSFRSCLLRIPNSLNGKCLAKDYKIEKSRVRIIQELNGYRPPIKDILLDF